MRYTWQTIAVAVIGIGGAGCATTPKIIPGGAVQKLSKTIHVPGPADYEIEVRGTLDSYNTHVYGRVHRPGFQPNLELTITNVGDEPVVNPRISIN